MQLIIPLTGIGSRFINAGYEQPKPLIQVLGKPMIQHVCSMFEYDQVIFIINPEHHKYDIVKVLKSIDQNSIIIEEKEHKKLGPVYHTLLAEKFITEGEVIVSYCDYYMQFDWNKFISFDKKDSCVLSYKGYHPHLLHNDLYGSLTEENNIITNYKEKYCFTESNQQCYQSAGAYYFKSGHDLIKYSKIAMEKEPINGEWYTSQVVMALMQEKEATVFEVDKFCQWGTPRDLEEFNKWIEVILQPKTFAYWSEFYDRYTQN